MNKLTHVHLLEMKRWNTPTIYNGWEQITSHDSAHDGFNLETIIDFMPQMGPMVGYAVTVVCEPSNPQHKLNLPDAWGDYRRYIASVKGPKIVVVQDLDKPDVFGAFWGEVNSAVHRALGCVGTITDGAIRDLDEMIHSGFKAIARGMCVGHAHSYPVRWNCPVEVFGRRIKPGQLIHADKHGFLVIPDEDATTDLLEAARFMDSNECSTSINAAVNASGLLPEQILDNLEEADRRFKANLKEKFVDQT